MPTAQSSFRCIRSKERPLRRRVLYHVQSNIFQVFQADATNMSGTEHVV